MVTDSKNVIISQGLIQLLKNDSWFFLVKITTNMVLNVAHHGWETNKNSV